MELTKIEWIVGNKVYVLSDEYVHLGNDGLASPPVDRQEEEGPQQDGATDVGFRLMPRNIKLILFFSGSSLSDYYAKRRRLTQQFRPREQASKLRFTLPDGEVRQIDAVYKSDLTLPSSDKAGYSHQAVVILRAADPIFYDPAVKNINFQISVSGNSFAVPLEVPWNVGTATLDQTTQVIYSGDWKTSPLITVIGPVEDLLIENETTGEKLDFDGYTLSAGNRLIIDTSYANASVVNDAGASMLQHLSDDSDLTTFHLDPDPDALDGVNSIRVRGSSATTQTQVYLSYNERFIGI